jgi:hypothetical protein
VFFHGYFTLALFLLLVAEVLWATQEPENVVCLGWNEIILIGC